MHHNMYEWNTKGNIGIKILQKSESLQILKDLGLPVPETKHVCADQIITGSSLDSYVQSYSPILVLATPKDRISEKKGKFDINTCDELSDFVKNINQNNAYEYTLMPLIQGIKESYIGTALNSGEQLFMELLVDEFVTDLRKLTSGGADSKKLIHGECFGKILKTTNTTHRRELSVIRDYCSILPGYYEFIKGAIHGKSGLWFVDYQNDAKYTNLLR